MKTLSARILLYIVVCAIIAGVAFSGRPFWIQLAIGITITAILALAWDILSRTGQVSLGMAAFFGLGAYTTAILDPIANTYVAWLGVIIVCGLVAAMLGLLTLRLRQMYFAIATLGFTLSLQVLVLVFPDFTGGAGGIAPPLLSGGDPMMQLLAIGVLLLVAMLVSDILLGGRFRPAFFMIRTKPELAASCGVPVVRTRILAFVISGIIAGLAGACYGGLYGYVTPTDVYTMNWSVMPLAVAVLGGMDTTLGPLLGAIILRILEEVARGLIGGVGYQVVYGAVIILFVVGLPHGVTGALKSLLGWSDRVNARPRLAASEG